MSKGSRQQPEVSAGMQRHDDGEGATGLSEPSLKVRAGFQMKPTPLICAVAVGSLRPQRGRRATEQDQMGETLVPRHSFRS